MSAYSGATPGGFNQSGGGYYIVTATLPLVNLLALTPGSGSGGATTAGSFGNYTSTISDTTAISNLSTLFTAGKLIKDMGKTVVSAGRAFRKFQAVLPASASTGGVVGAAGSATQAGYATPYLEVTAPSAGGSGVVVNTIARYA